MGIFTNQVDCPVHVERVVERLGGLFFAVRAKSKDPVIFWVPFASRQLSVQSGWCSPSRRDFRAEMYVSPGAVPECIREWGSE